jgi:hypothetical protein
MSHLRLSIAADNVKVPGEWQPFLKLFFVTECLNGSLEHGSVHTDWDLTLMHVEPVVAPSLSILKVKLTIFFKPDVIDLLHPIELDFLTGELVELVV